MRAAAPGRGGKGHDVFIEPTPGRPSSSSRLRREGAFDDEELRTYADLHESLAWEPDRTVLVRLPRRPARAHPAPQPQGRGRNRPRLPRGSRSADDALTVQDRRWRVLARSPTPSPGLGTSCSGGPLRTACGARGPRAGLRVGRRALWRRRRRPRPGRAGRAPAALDYRSTTPTAPPHAHRRHHALLADLRGPGHRPRGLAGPVLLRGRGARHARGPRRWPACPSGPAAPAGALLRPLVRAPSCPSTPACPSRHGVAPAPAVRRQRWAVTGRCGGRASRSRRARCCGPTGARAGWTCWRRARALSGPAAAAAHAASSHSAPPPH